MFGGPNIIISLIRGMQEETEEGNVMTEVVIEAMNFEDEGRGCKPRNASGHQKLKKARKKISPQSLWKEPSPY